MSYAPVADGELAAVVTFLEMRARPDIIVPSSPLKLRRLTDPAPDDYRALFRLVGGPWLWFSRLLLDDAALSEIIHDPNVELFLVTDDAAADSGMIELDFREGSECELAFIGLVPELAGKGHGRWLLAEALDRAWRPGITRVRVHSCTLDHPAALAAYARAGFVAVGRAVETFPDPRLTGILPRSSAPQVPIFGASTVSLPDS